MNYRNLFREGKIGNTVIKNRIVYAPVGDNMANADGSFSEQSIAWYTEKARGGAGIIMPGAIPAVYPVGNSHPLPHRMDQKKFIRGMWTLTRNCHSFGAKVIPQIQHAGARTTSEITGGVMPVCVSDIDPETLSIRKCRQAGRQHELSTEELKTLVPEYVKTALNCQMAECDGVEIHMAHSYLLNELLSPDTNRRTDEYGGSIENRMRLPLEIIRAVRKACGSDFIISARIPGIEFVTNGLTEDEIRIFAAELEKAGCDVINVSVGMTVDQTNIREPQGTPEGSRLDRVANVRNAVSVPVMTSGVLKTPEFCDRILGEDKLDFVVMARQLICDPFWPAKAEAGRANEIRPCLTCNDGCFGALVYNRPVGCVLNPLAGNEYSSFEKEKACEPKKVLVIGGGIAGMQAAITACRRGHSVTLAEKENILGGQLNIAGIPPGKESICDACRWFVEETLRAGAEVKTDVEADMDFVIKQAPDAIIFAAGALPWSPPFSGKEKAIQAWDILKGDAVIPESVTVAVIGGGLVGCETGLLLQKYGNKVSIIEMMPEAAAGLEAANREHLLRNLTENGGEIFTDTAVQSIGDDSVVCIMNGRTETIPADVTVLAVGQRPSGGALYNQLKEAGFSVRKTGDADRPAKIGSAVMAGYLAAAEI